MALATTTLASEAALVSMYSGGDMSVDSNWFIREGVAGTDGDLSGIIDTPGNNGPIVSGDGNAGWQLRDQNGTSAGDLPQLQYAINPTLTGDMNTNGFTLTFVIENVGSGGGIWFGQDGTNFGSAADSRVSIVNNALIANDNNEHTVAVTWDGISLTRTIDGGAAATLSLSNNADNNYTGPDTGGSMFLVDSGSSGGTVAGWNIISAELNVVPEPSSTALLGLGGLALILRRRK